MEARTTKEALIWIDSESNQPTRAELMKLLKTRRLQKEEMANSRFNTINVVDSTNIVESHITETESTSVNESCTRPMRSRSPLRTEAQDAFIDRSIEKDCIQSSQDLPLERSSLISNITETRMGGVESQILKDAMTQTDKIEQPKSIIYKKKRHIASAPTKRTHTIITPNAAVKTTKMKMKTGLSRRWNDSSRLERPGYERSIRTDEPFFDMSSVSKKSDLSSSLPLYNTTTVSKVEIHDSITTITEKLGISTEKSASIDTFQASSSKRNDGIISRMKSVAIKSTRENVMRRLSESNLESSFSRTVNQNHNRASRSLSPPQLQSQQKAFGLASDSPALIKDRQARDRIQILKTKTASSSSPTISSNTIQTKT
jgi:hypothetical protein